MSSSEKGLWEYVNAKMRALHGSKWHGCRIETGATSNGQPDVNYCLDGVEDNLELKFARKNKWCELRPSQYQWMKKRARAGKQCWILVEITHQNRWLLIASGSAEVLIKHKEQPVWTSAATAIWDGSIDFEELSDYLRG